MLRVLVRAGGDADARRRSASTSGPEQQTALYAAGADVGGISTGGWSSGLASALVLGLVAAESALG